MKMPKMIKNVGKMHKMWSVRFGGASVLLLLQEIVPLWQGIVPDNVFTILGAIAASAAIVGRAVDQNLEE
jgi:hypothetical protein